MKKRIAFIGSGKMAEALLSGIIKSILFSRSNIFVSDKDNDRRVYISKKYKVKNFSSNLKAAENADIIILSVKPLHIYDVISDIKPAAKNKLIISIAAGINLGSIEKRLPNSAVVRVMPNAPCLLQHGISAICAGKNASKRDLDIAMSIFDAVGHVVTVPERDMDAVTALSGSGPAFVYFFVRAMIDGGVKNGLSFEVAKKLAFETVFGASYMLKHSGQSPDELISMVASPGGTTIAGLSVLEKSSLNKDVSSAIIEAYKRSIEIGREFEA